eukprot:scaffold577_cov405-Prasinococcus_capsulatus_cf.AAC.8
MSKKTAFTFILRPGGGVSVRSVLAAAGAILRSARVSSTRKKAPRFVPAAPVGLPPGWRLIDATVSHTLERALQHSSGQQPHSEWRPPRPRRAALVPAEARRSSPAPRPQQHDAATPHHSKGNGRAAREQRQAC